MTFRILGVTSLLLLFGCQNMAQQDYFIDDVKINYKIEYTIGEELVSFTRKCNDLSCLTEAERNKLGSFKSLFKGFTNIKYIYSKKTSDGISYEIVIDPFDHIHFGLSLQKLNSKNEFSVVNMAFGEID
jgi:hypothetical protein